MFFAASRWDNEDDIKSARKKNGHYDDSELTALTQNDQKYENGHEKISIHLPMNQNT